MYAPSTREEAGLEVAVAVAVAVFPLSWLQPGLETAVGVVAVAGRRTETAYVSGLGRSSRIRTRFCP